MSDYVKRLPPAALPEGGVASWSVADAERWRAARVPAIFSPAVGSWLLLVLVTASYVLTSGFSAPRWNGGASMPGDTDWLGYPATVLLTALPWWYRYLPVPTVPAAVMVAVEAARSLASSDTGDRLATSGYCLALAVSAGAFTGAWLRLRARREQRALALAAAGPRRHELPDGAPETDDYRGYRQFYLGLGLCLVAGVLLIHGLVNSLMAPDHAPYDAVGQQVAALLFLVPGTTVYGRGHVAYRAARRLNEAPQPALLVGVRIGPDGYHWLYPDARTTSGRPLITYFPRARDTDGTARLLGTDSAYGAGDGHYDIDPRSEPFEAVLYGAPWEGAEVALEYAVIDRSAYQGSERTYAAVTVAQLLPRRHHGLGPWQPADGAARAAARRERIRKEERERREWAEKQEERLRQRQRTSSTRRTPRGRGGGTRGRRHGRPGSWGEGHGCGTGGHSCGGSHGCGGHGCGGHGCGGA
ncbi:hypothetical protein ADL22_24930 [Streptomyces sp. NRRL F-4489]|uniref:hypothetical protein n=1 Tax=Streptomyces sp. NRRL F-4489 TaxID=1609095 RepID=UPI00074AE64E|nr:hypothetical protein [Streptomyces sp. NRRL F-4489]KUL36315.1 hypothetical protein ADL22_24930 [Streptomyces sp. NRRL F-4489]